MNGDVNVCPLTMTVAMPEATSCPLSTVMLLTTGVMLRLVTLFFGFAWTGETVSANAHAVIVVTSDSHERRLMNLLIIVVDMLLNFEAGFTS